MKKTIYKNLNKKIALVCGGLELPFFARDALQSNGWEVFVVGLKNFYDEKLKPDMIIRIGAGGSLVKELKKRDIKTICFVGAIGHPNLSDIRPDLWSISVLASVMKNQTGYDSMGATLIKEIEKRGFNVVAAQILCPELTFDAGVKTRAKPAAADKKDIARAIDVSKIIGAADIGTSVVVDKQVVAVEASEGTAKMLARAVEMRKKHRGKSSGVFAKMTKPGQDLRFDIPAIGVDTVRSVYDAKLRGIMIDADTCFVVNKPAVIAAADKLGIFISVI